MRHLLKPLNGCSFLVMLLLIADVVYHPFQILRAETNDTIACLPIQDFAIYKLVINVVRTRAFQLPNPIADQKRGRNRNRDVHVSLSAADFMKDQTLGLQYVTTNVAVKPRLNFGADDWQAVFHVPGEVEIDFGVGARGHEVMQEKPAEAG